MPLSKAQLMEVPGGPGVTGSVKAGTGISISADGTVSVDASTNITKIVAGTNVTLNPTSGVGVVTISAAGGGGGEVFPSGTSIVFAQASAPTGWTKATDMNDCALRLVSGSGGGTGGSTSFSSAFSSYTPNGSVNVSLSGLSLSSATTNTVDQTPRGTVSVSLSGLSLTGASTNTVSQTPQGSVSLSGASIGPTTISVTQMPSHTHSYQQRTQSPPNLAGGNSGVGNQNAASTGSDGGNGQHSHSFSGSGSFNGQSMSHSHSVTGSVGGNASGSFTGQSMSHSHTVTGSVSGNASGTFSGTATTQFTVKYKDVIICTKN